MRVLFIGGTGIISTACTRLAAESGIELTLLTRGRRAAGLPAGVKTLTVDMEDDAAVARALDGMRFDAVVDWIAYTPGAHRTRSAAVRRAHAAVHLHQLRQRLSEAGDRLPDYRIDAAREPVLGVFAQQDRLRGAAHEGLPRRGLSR
jgi:uncharacterized protein YbjT (DUF2867 family)